MEWLCRLDEGNLSVIYLAVRQSCRTWKQQTYADAF